MAKNVPGVFDMGSERLIHPQGHNQRVETTRRPTPRFQSCGMNMDVYPCVSPLSAAVAHPDR